MRQVSLETSGVGDSSPSLGKTVSASVGGYGASPLSSLAGERLVEVLRRRSFLATGQIRE